MQLRRGEEEEEDTLLKLQLGLSRISLVRKFLSEREAK